MVYETRETDFLLVVALDDEARSAFVHFPELSQDVAHFRGRVERDGGGHYSIALVTFLAWGRWTRSARPRLH